MAKLWLKLRDGSVGAIPLATGDLTIGRKASNDVVLDDPAVSGEHARIFTIGDDSFIEDRASTNGTRVAKRRITKHHLLPGDVIEIGPYTLTYENDQLATEALADFAPPETDARKPALFVLSGPANGRRIDMQHSITHLGKPGSQAGVITRTPNGYLLTSQGSGNHPLRVNGKSVAAGGIYLDSGDVIDVAESRFQFHFDH